MSEAVSQVTVKITDFSLYRPRLRSVFIAILLISLLSLLFVWSRIHAINLEYSIRIVNYGRFGHGPDHCIEPRTVSPAGENPDGHVPGHSSTPFFLHFHARGLFTGPR
jgi:hypothetical protein